MGAKRIKVDTRKKAELGLKKGPEAAPVKLTGFEGVRLWIELHQRQLLIGAVAVLLAAGVVWGVEAYLKSVERRAQVAYAVIFDTFPQEGAEASAWEPMLPAIDKFLSEHASSKVALNARADKARVLYQLKRYNEALEINRKLLTELPAGSEMKAFVLYQLAADSQALGKSDEAIELWNRLKSEGPEGLKREADWNLGKLHEKKGDLAKAAEHLELALKDAGSYPAPPQIQEVLDAVKRKSGAATPKPEPPKTEAPQGPKTGS